jgi:hypothetical protein
MAARLFNQPPPKPTQAPQTHADWHNLMVKVIEKADRTGDPRVPGLRKALAEGKTEKHLRMLSIIHEGDIHREFPATDT